MGNVGGDRNNGSGFALIVVLFILLIIVGASFLSNCDHGGGYGGGY
ncbi:YjcZ family sporulation protein [Psychrobacillus sp. FSL H8-0483]